MMCLETLRQQNVVQPASDKCKHWIPIASIYRTKVSVLLTTESLNIFCYRTLIIEPAMCDLQRGGGGGLPTYQEARYQPQVGI